MISKTKCKKCIYHKNDKRKVPCCWCRADKKNTHFEVKTMKDLFKPDKTNTAKLCETCFFLDYEKEKWECKHKQMFQLGDQFVIPETPSALFYCYFWQPYSPNKNKE
jgi:hypothetical protein